MNKKRKEIIANNEISEIYTLNLGGYNQKILVECIDRQGGYNDSYEKYYRTNYVA